METFSDYVASIENEVHRKKFAQIGEWMNENYPKLQLKFGWSQPMFTDHGTFIIGFKKKNYITVSPEVAGMKKFKEDIDAAVINTQIIPFKLSGRKQLIMTY